MAHLSSAKLQSNATGLQLTFQERIVEVQPVWKDNVKLSALASPDAQAIQIVKTETFAAGPHELLHAVRPK